MTQVGVDRVLESPGGRRVSVWDGGDPAGVPVLFHHGTPSSRLQAHLGHEAAVRQRVRLVSVNRPGYGASTNTPPSIALVGDDSIVIADELGIDDFAVLGVSGGGPYAVATGLAAPARTRAVGIAAGTGPWRLVEPGDDEERRLLALADAGQLSECLAGFRELAAREMDPLLALDDAEMVTAYFEGAPAGDVGWLDDHATMVWAADMRDALTTYDGYARDNVAWGGVWDIDVARLTPPTWLWYGADDLIVPASHGHWLAARIPHATLEVRPGAGHGSTSFGHWDEMLATLRDRQLSS